MNVVMSREFLYDEYIKKKNPIASIARSSGYSVGTVFNYIKKFKIKTRTHSELFSGEGNPNYGGMSPEHRKKLSLAKMGNSYGSKGGRKYNGSGYVLIYIPSHPKKDKAGYIREHHLVMENSIKRHLRPKEVCHHINSVKDDNRIENLMLFSSQSAHIRFEKGGIVKLNEIIFDGRLS